MKENNKRVLNSILILIIFIITLLYSLSFVTANLGSFKQGDCVDIKTILNTSSVNISTINYPNLSIVVSNKLMTKNGYTFNYTFCNTSALGNYIYDYFDSNGNVYVNDFTITTTGFQLDTSKSIIILIGLGIMLIIGILLFIFGVYSKTPIIKIFSIGLSILMITFSVGYSINVLRAGVGEYPNLISSFNGLYYLITVLLICGGAGLVLFLVYTTFQYWSKLRGFRD